MGLRHFGLLALVGLVGGVVALAAPAPPPRPWVDGWKIVDPEKTSTIEREGDSLTITFARKSDDSGSLPVGFSRRDIPCLLREVSGDFVAEVRLSGSFMSSEGQQEGLDAAFRAGLQLKGEKKWFARVTRETFLFGDETITRLSATIATAKNAPEELSSDREVYLRLSRKGNSLSAAFSADGKKWRQVGSADSSLPAKLRLGVFAAPFTTAPAPFKVHFDKFKLTRQGP